MMTFYSIFKIRNNVPKVPISTYIFLLIYAKKTHLKARKMNPDKGHLLASKEARCPKCQK